MFVYEVRDRLVAQGVGTYGTNIFIGQKAVIPSGDGPYLSLVETGGSGAARTHGGASLERPSMQLSCRATTTAAARTMLAAAYAALGGADGLHNISLSGTWYVSLVAVQYINEIGEDAAGRPMLAFNVDAEKKPS